VTTVEILALVADPAEPGPVSDAAAALGRAVERLGLTVRQRREVALDEAAAERALRQAIEGGGLVAVLGDEEGALLARRALARILGVRLVLNDRLLEAVATGYARRDQAMPRRAEALALVPSGASVLPDPAGAEPGLLVEVSGARVALLPAGDPASLLAAHLPQLVLPAWEPVAVTRTLRLVGLDPVEAAARLHAALGDAGDVHGRVVDDGDELRVRLRVAGPTLPAADQAFRALEPALRAAFEMAWYAEDDEALEAVVGRLLRARGFTIALAESCTGGLVGHRLTQIPGSSAYVERGFIVYSNAAKEALLGVPPPILARHGAVSAACAEAMALGARTRAGTDLGLSVTGIAGPDGATPTKPVGTVFVALAGPDAVRVEHHRFDRDRAGNKAWAATRALDLVRRYCLGAP
jgi:nicotinamide-nucleotide amidase